MREASRRGIKPRKVGGQWRELDRVHNGWRARIDFAGYVIVYEPGRSTRANGSTKNWCWEHRLVAEQTIGRRLTSAEQVHHVNGIKTDNRPENLMVLSRREHKQLHNDETTEKLRRLEEYERRFGPLVDAKASVATIAHWLPVTAAMLEEVERRQKS